MKKVVMVFFLLGIIFMMVTNASAVVGASDNGLLNTEWYLDLNQVYGAGYFGATPAIANLEGVNTYGGEPDSDLEIVTGSDGYGFHQNPDVSASGIWRSIDSQGNVEWYRNTLSDESRGSVAFADLDGDGNLEIIGSTSSGVAIEVMDRFGNFIWTFPDGPKKGIYMAGEFMFPSAPAVGDLDPTVSGLEVVAVHKPTCTVIVFDGDNSDGVNDGITFTGIPGYNYTWSGTEGIDWDVLWIYTMGDPSGNSYCYGSAAIADVDNDGALEVVVGSQTGGVYIFDGATGTPKYIFETGEVQASPAIANLDADPQLEIVVGDIDGLLHIFKYDGSTGSNQSTYLDYSSIYSSASIGDIDGDGGLDIIVGTYGGTVYALDSGLNQKWVYPSTGTAGSFYASPALVNTQDVNAYDIESQMFRYNAMRTGFYGITSNSLDVIIGSIDSYLYILRGNNGTLIDRLQASGPIHGSPTVGDIDGDGKLNILFQSWGSLLPGAPTVYDRFWNVELTLPTVIEVTIDIKPGSYPNSINLGSNGTVPVAIFSTATFDATTVNPTTVTLASAPVKLKGNGTPMSSFEDVNRDGLLDIVVHVLTSALQLSYTDKEAILEGKTFNDRSFRGSDSVRVVP